MSGYVRYVRQSVKPPASRLAFLDIELTERCNSRCIHCYINQPAGDLKFKAREMSTAFVKDVLKQAANLGCLTVRFTGGEPLLREDFSELYLFARRLGLKVLLFTNARLITPELAGHFARIPPGEPIEVSVYGMHARSYDQAAGVTGAFEQYQQGITLLKEHCVPFTVKQSLLPSNRDERPEFEAFAASLSRSGKKPDYTMNFDLRARRDDQAKNRQIRGLRFSAEETLAELTKEPGKFAAEMRHFAGKYMRAPGDKLFNCGAGLGTCIDAYGRAQMCMLLRHPDTVYFLDLEQHKQKNPGSELMPLEYALDNFFPQVRQMRTSNPEYLQRCAACFLHGLCEQCPAKSWEEHGTLDQPVEYCCRVAHVKAVYLGLVREGEKAWELAPAIRQARLKAFTGAQGE